MKLSRDSLTELLRLTMLASVALLVAHPYFSARLIGTGDALWYHHLLADAVTQFRARVFPVFVGQSDYSFNGAVYPLRAAPYYQYFAGGLDFITGQTLSFFALQHLTALLSFLGGILGAYFALVWVAPRQQWTAAILATLYVLCPSVAGLFYAQNLYMSGMALPWVPLACAALVRSFDDNSSNPLIMLAVSLAALWWAHSPIALWVTLVATFAQLAAIYCSSARKSAFRRSVIGSALFIVLAAYPIISVFLLRTPGETIVPYVMDRTELLREVRATFPASVLPINYAAPPLTHLQLGYSLWLTLLVATVACFRFRQISVILMISAAWMLLLLIFPVPGITRALWFSFPETLVGMTLYWPVQRLGIIIAALTVICAQRALADFKLPTHRFSRWALAITLLLSVAWSSSEIANFIRKARAQAEATADSQLLALPENVAIQSHTYGLLSGRPAYFNHGVVEPRLEFRLLDPTDNHIIASNYPSLTADAFRDVFSGVIDVNPGIINLRPALTLTPGQHYFLTFDFIHPNTTGILQIIGPKFYREYVLPLAGERKAFGAGPVAEKTIALWTTTENPQTLELRFIPTAPGAVTNTYIPFARYRFASYDPASLPICVDSLIPLRAFVRSPNPALLETPRMFVPGYIATVNGTPVTVKKSREGLVTFPVPTGESRIEVRFAGHVALRAALWLSLVGWIVGAALLSYKLTTSKFRRLLADGFQFSKG
jgi:hypothetical protein